MPKIRFNTVCLVTICVTFFPLSLHAQSTPTTRPALPAWSPVGRLDPAVIREASGVVASRRQQGVYWAHPDSGNDAHLVAFDLSGKVLANISVAGAINIDWEDICADDDGHLYVGDIGNNTGLLPSRQIYKFVEPDPANPPAGPIHPVARYNFRYPDDKRFNAESLFWRDGKLYLISRVPREPSQVYRLDESGDDTLTLTPIGEVPAISASGADFDQQRGELVVCGARYAIIVPFDGTKGFTASETGRRIYYPPIGTMEAVCFDGDNVVMVTEAGGIYQVKRTDFDNRTTFRRPPTE